MLLADPAALDYYQDYVDVHCLLHWQHGPGETSASQRSGIRDRIGDRGADVQLIAPIISPES